MVEPRPISVSVLPGGGVHIEVGEEFLALSEQEYARLKSLLAQKPAKRETK